MDPSQPSWPEGVLPILTAADQALGSECPGMLGLCPEALTK